MIRFNVTDELSDDVNEAICVELRRFNAENNSIFWNARELPANAARGLYVVARNADGRILGGLLAETQFAWLKVSIMSVSASDRGCGVGSRLLAAAESAAIDRGCRYAYVDTMEYQAPGFYQKRGYERVGVLEDWDSHGHAKLFFVKRLCRPANEHSTDDGIKSE